MTINKITSVKKKQQGIVLLVFVIVIALTISSIYFSSISIVDAQLESKVKTQIALKRAKQALIEYAALHAHGAGSGDFGEFGYLPCPDEDDVNEGRQEGACGATNLNVLGYLPWSSMGIEPLKDGNGNCLWYGVSGSYKNNPNSGLINEDTNGQFQIVDEAGGIIKGDAPEERLVAIVIAPGKPLTGQSRVISAASFCGNDYSLPPSAYLEGNGLIENDILGVVADGVDQFLHATLSSGEEYNDVFVTVSREEIWSAITQRDDFTNKMDELTKELAECLVNYANKSGRKRLPWPAPIELGDYRIATDYDDFAGYTGRYPFIIKDSNDIMVSINDELFLQADCDTAGGLAYDLKFDPPPPPPVFKPSEHRVLWNNWKDHFYYVLSKDFEPDAATGDALCGVNCVTVDMNKMAAIVIYAPRQPGQIRNRDPDTKKVISNYIDDESNQIEFTAATGKGVYDTGGNNIMYCIKEDMTVALC